MGQRQGSEKSGKRSIGSTVIDLSHIALDGHDRREGREKTQAVVFRGAVEVPGAQELDLHHALEVLGRHELREGVLDDTCPVNEPVYPSVLLDHLIQGAIHFPRVTDVTAMV